MENNTKSSSSLLDSLSKYRSLYAEIWTLIRNKHPEFRETINKDQIVKIPTIQKELLDKDECLVQYFTGLENSYCFYIDQEEFHFFKIKDGEHLKELAQSFRSNISNQKTKEYAQDAKALYDIVLGQLQSIVDLKKNIIVIPDGYLNFVPFEALLTDLPDEEQMAQLKNYPYLIHKHAFSYDYSASLWQTKLNSKEAQSDKLEFAAFAPSFTGNELKLPGQFEKDKQILGKLDLNIEEVQKINKLLEGDLYIKRKAGLERFFKIAKNYDIIHLATHGVANNEDGDYSFIVFAGKKKKPYDFLYAKDLYKLELNAKLVVLSACETNAGEWQKGEGVISLSRGFAYAGCQSLLTSLWLAEEQSSMILTQHFYKELLNANAKAKALQNVKINYIKNQNLHRKAHPFYWAGYILIGNQKAIVKK